ncbi:MAG: hypothetical protein JW837_12960 [Sedimentisphaerales bacterium]|nr:hypothetical protein [Sedimentisphaerales bacterium]
MYYKGKKRRDSRYWWRRMWSRKYRPLLIKKTLQITMVTIALSLLALLTAAYGMLYFLAWCLIVGIIIFPLQRQLSDTQSVEHLLKTQKSKTFSKSQKVKTISQQTAKAPIHPVKEIPPKKIEAESPKTSRI